MSSGSSQPLVLEYKKRRYDGGNEREIIEHIEYQHRMCEQQRVAAAWQAAGQQNPYYQHQAGHPQGYPPQAVPPMPIQQVPPPPPPIEHPPAANMREELYRAVVMPYVELILGLSGVLVGNIMFVTLMRNAAIRPEALQRDREALIQQSWLVIRNSTVNILKCPWTVAKLMLKRSSH